MTLMEADEKAREWGEGGGGGGYLKRIMVAWRNFGSGCFCGSAFLCLYEFCRRPKEKSP